MNREEEAHLLADLARVADACERSQQAAVLVEKRKADALDREVAIRQNDLETYPERCRQQRHHDVLCLVLKELVRDDRARHLDMIPGPTVEVARKFADLAYPPTKAES